MIDGKYAKPSGGIPTGDIADNAVTTAKLADGVVTTPKLADGAVAMDKLDAQVRAAILAGAGSFVAVYGETTSAEIEDAYQAGTVCKVQNGAYTGYLVERESATRHIFSIPTNTHVEHIICENDVWTFSSKGRIPQYFIYQKSGGSWTGPSDSHVVVQAIALSNNPAIAYINMGNGRRLQSAAVYYEAATEQSAAAAVFVFEDDESNIFLRHDINGTITATEVPIGNAVFTAAYTITNSTTITCDKSYSELAAQANAGNQIIATASGGGLAAQTSNIYLDANTNAVTSIFTQSGGKVTISHFSDNSITFNIVLDVAVDTTIDASSTNAIANSAVTAALDDKLDINQGTANAGKFLVVGADGNITLQAMTSAETEAL